PLTGFNGVDQIDITASNGWARVVLSEDFIAQSDDGSVTVSYGSAGIGSVVVDTDNPDDYSFEYGDNKITVSYNTDEPEPEPEPQPEPEPEPIAGEHFYLSGGADTITGTAGDDTVYG